MYLKNIFDSLLIDTIEPRIRMQHMVYRLGYKEWVKNEIKKNIEKKD